MLGRLRHSLQGRCAGHLCEEDQGLPSLHLFQVGRGTGRPFFCSDTERGIQTVFVTVSRALSVSFLDGPLPHLPMFALLPWHRFPCAVLPPNGFRLTAFRDHIFPKGMPAFCAVGPISPGHAVRKSSELGGGTPRVQTVFLRRPKRNLLRARQSRRSSGRAWQRGGFRPVESTGSCPSRLRPQQSVRLAMG